MTRKGFPKTNTDPIINDKVQINPELKRPPFAEFVSRIRKSGYTYVIPVPSQIRNHADFQVGDHVHVIVMAILGPPIKFNPTTHAFEETPLEEVTP